MKRVLSLALLLLLMWTLALPCAAADTALPKVREYTGFSDVPAGAWYESALKVCYEAEVLNGISDTRFGPQEPLTTAQLEVLTARVHWRLQGNEGDLPSAPAGTGQVSIIRSDGTAYDAAGFARVNDSGLKDKTLPKGDYILTIGGNYEDEGFPYMTIQVDGVKSFRANLDKRNSYDPLFYMFRYHISEADYQKYDPMVRVNTYSQSNGACVDAWYWGADLYLRGLDGAMEAELPTCLVDNATRYDAAAVMSLIASDEMLPALHENTPPDTDRADVLRLYRAGVITGVDDQGTFNGGGTLTRAQFAVLLARLLEPDLRVKPTSEPQSSQLEYTLEKLPETYQTAVKDTSFYTASWSDLTAVQNIFEPDAPIIYLYSNGEPVRDLDASFPGCAYLSAMLDFEHGGRELWSNAWDARDSGYDDAILVAPYVDGIAPVYFENSSAYGYWSQEGTVLISPVFRGAGALVGGTAIVMCADGDFYRLTVIN